MLRCALFSVLMVFGVVLWSSDAHAQTPQDFKVCSDTACVQIIVTPVVPPCPVKPADQTRPGVCPVGTTGSWTQTQTYASAPAPTCWTPSGFLPATPPAGACVTPPPVTPPAPPNLTAVFTRNATNPANSNLTLTWGAIPGTVMYEVYRCTGPNCTTFSWLADEPLPTSTVLNQQPGFVVKYKVRVWKPITGPYTPVLTLTTPVNPPQTADATATINWTAPTQNTDGSTLTNLAGFRIVYGQVPTALASEVVVPNPGISSYVVDKLNSGSWYFAVSALAGSAACLPADADCVVKEGPLSNIASKVIP